MSRKNRFISPTIVGSASAGFTRALIHLADLQREKQHLLTGQGLDAAGDAGGEEAGIKIEGTLPGPSSWPTSTRAPES
ncbi:hypothetical protein [Streptomyces coeruleorubidus]|uniref:hypothetical protein n=1 Tax=Streptomyces coeruleorubidus TaxID=116188 RepID=UPI003403A475